MCDATILATDKLYDKEVSYELQFHTHHMVNPQLIFFISFAALELIKYVCWVFCYDAGSSLFFWIVIVLHILFIIIF